MQKFFFIYLFFSSAVGILWANNLTVVPYLATANYKDSFKSDALLGGIYAKLKVKKRSYEFAYENTTINFKNNTSAIKKSDFTFLYSQPLNNHYKAKLGIHLTLSNNTSGDDVQAYFTGVEYFQANSFALGIDAYYSFYSQSDLGKEVLQLKPYYSFEFSEYNSLMGKFFVKFNYYYINFMQKTKNSLNRSYISYGLEINHHKNNFLTTLKAWSGKQVYAIRDNGFTLYNLYEKHKGGWSLSSRYTLSRDFSLRASYINEVYSNIGTSSLSYTDTYLLSGEVKF